LPKQFADLGGRSVLEAAVGCLAGRPGVDGVVVVLSMEQTHGEWGTRARAWPGVSRVVAGGTTRAESVLAGVRAAAGARYVLVHDAARPLAPARLVDAVVEATRRHGAAIPVLEVPDTLKALAGGWVVGGPDRRELRLAQTPQGFRAEELRRALERALAEGAEPTDEAMAAERDGVHVAAVAGDPGNFKITVGEDLERARAEHRVADPGWRVGSGFDIHGIDAGRPLILGGVRFADEPGLAGHSDADVILHAAMDALLGAAGLEDIGARFPPSDPAFAGAASTELARQVAAAVREQGYEVVNLDLTLLAEAPRIRTRVAEMRAAIGACLGVPPSCIGLKATTLEGLGALGRREGAACQAVCLLRACRRTP
jgi:2-C-methyl-D-erythritol 4-phosphate cytidylyltransferase / 2-C-methyl-D-erythritol 2,4-cyclodiphosphate synthase